MDLRVSQSSYEPFVEFPFLDEHSIAADEINFTSDCSTSLRIILSFLMNLNLLKLLLLYHFFFEF